MTFQLSAPQEALDPENYRQRAIFENHNEMLDPQSYWQRVAFKNRNEASIRRDDGWMCCKLVQQSSKKIRIMGKGFCR